MRRPRAARILTVAGVSLTLLCAASMVAALAGGTPPGGGTRTVLDAAVFLVFWAFLAATPLLAGLALLFGDRSTGGVKVNYAVLAVWLAFFLWTLTLTF